MWFSFTYFNILMFGLTVKLLVDFRFLFFIFMCHLKNTGNHIYIFYIVIFSHASENSSDQMIFRCFNVCVSNRNCTMKTRLGCLSKKSDSYSDFSEFLPPAHETTARCLKWVVKINHYFIIFIVPNICIRQFYSRYNHMSTVFVGV